MAPPTAGPTTGGRGMASTEHSNARQRIMVLTMFPDLLMLLWGCLRLKKFFFFGFLASTMGGGRKWGVMRICLAVLALFALVFPAELAWKCEGSVAEEGDRRWPPPAKYSLPVGDGSPAAGFLEEAIQASLMGQDQQALRALHAVVRLLPRSPCMHAMLAHAQCREGQRDMARASLAMAVQLRKEGVMEEVELEEGDEGGVDHEPWKTWSSASWGGANGCVPLPLLYPPSSVVHEETVVGDVDEDGQQGLVHRRVYVVEDRSEEGTMIIRQSTDHGPLREAFVLDELGFSLSPLDNGGIPPPFPTVVASASPPGSNWKAVAVANFEAPSLSTVLAEDPDYFGETAQVFDFLDRMLVIEQQLQGAGVTHSAITPDNVLVLAGDMPALVNFDFAVAQGMPFRQPNLPGYLKDMYEGVEGDLGRGETSDIYALGKLVKDSMPAGAAIFAPILDMMTQKQRHERITHVLSLRLLIGSCVENRSDLVDFRQKILEARQTFRQTVAAFPESGIAHNNLGGVYFESQMLNDALSLFQTSLLLSLPFSSGARCNVAAVRQMTCCWAHRAEDAQAVIRIIDAGGQEVRSVRNLYAIALNLSMEQHLAISMGGANFSYAKAREDWVELSPPLALQKGGRLTLAYLSSDILTSHAVAGSMRMVLSLHDDKRIDLLLFVTKADQVAAARDDAAKAGLGMARLVDAAAMSQSQLASAINQNNVHVVIDCNGQTGRDAMIALSMRPAAIQIHYLGFPSTLGATFIDHVVGDRHVTPPELAGFYTEKLLLLPHTFQVTSHFERKPHPWSDARNEEEAMRADRVGYSQGEMEARRYHGLNDEGPLLCNFNQHFKLDPGMFQAWARIVNRVPGSSLVLLKYPEESEPNIREAAREAGLTGKQLILLPKAPLAEHLARTSFCDLFVDNREYNSGTTCTDALWAGAPTISLPREKHAGRHAASMLSSLGPWVGSLQARDLHDYEAMAEQLLTNPLKWRQIYSALAASREMVAPLWSPGTWVRHVERAVRMAWEWRVAKIPQDRGSPACPPSAGAPRKMQAGGPHKCHSHFAHILVHP